MFSSGDACSREILRFLAYFYLLICAVILLLPTLSYAYLEIPTGLMPPTQQDHIAATICRVVMIITGPMGQAFMIMVVITTAITMLFGKATWVVVAIIVCAIGAIFGAQNIVNMITGGNIDCRLLANHGLA